MREKLFQELYLLSQKQSHPVHSAAKLKEVDILQVIDFILSWAMDLLRLQWNASSEEMINKDFEKQLLDLKERTLISNNTTFMNYLQEIRRQFSEGLNLNKQLFVENIFICWMKSCQNT